MGAAVPGVGGFFRYLLDEDLYGRFGTRFVGEVYHPVELRLNEAESAAVGQMQENWTSMRLPDPYDATGLYEGLCFVQGNKPPLAVFREFGRLQWCSAGA